jgi:hypothetical protein
MARQILNAGRSTVLDASGNGRVEIGPDQGPPYWLVSTVIVKTSRPGQAPVPAFDLYKDAVDENNSEGTTYDGSRNESNVTIELTRGQKLIAVWTGGQAGDTATISVSGYKGDNR